MASLIIFSILLLYLNVASSVLAPYKELNDGNKMPVVALGTAGTPKYRKNCRQSVTWAIDAGYRHVDTASVYNNEEQVGLAVADAIKRGVVKREDMFITTKLWNDKHAREQVVPALREALKKLNFTYIDLYLIHSPIPEKPDGSFDEIDYLETWKGMEDAKKLGLAKSIGISNFNTEQIGRILDNCKIKPSVINIEVNPTLTQEELVNYCHNNSIVVMAISPFGFMVSPDGLADDSPPPRIDDPILQKIGDKYNKSTTQVVMRYLLDRDIVPIPKSIKKRNIESNFDVFDFHVTPEDIATINKFNKNVRVIDNPLWTLHPYYPYGTPGDLGDLFSL